MIRFRLPSLGRTAPSQASATIQIEGVKQRAIETGRARLIVTGAIFLLVFSVIAGRMVDITVLRHGGAQHARDKHGDDTALGRADIVDRNGVLLATSLPTDSLYVRPKDVRDPAQSAQALAKVLTSLSADDIQAKLTSDRAFLYIKRHLTPTEVYAVNALGIPGLYFEKDAKRVYPQGALAAHAVGLADTDGKGVAGIEKSFDAALAERQEPLRLSLDIRVQTVLHDELAKTMADFDAVGATGMVMDLATGELLGMVSLPDFDPNATEGVKPETMFNRATLGVYEMGSTFKLFDAAAALDTGTVTMGSSYDATHPIHVARFEITDDHPQARWLTVPEILIYSSNIGAAKMALDLGTDRQRDYLGRFGLLRPASIEVPEIGAPLVPNPWREINTMTIAFGHGMAVSPVQMMQGVGALVNGGTLRPATLLARAPGEAVGGSQVIKTETSNEIRELMRMVVTQGTGEKANVPGYEVGGKTGTAEKSGAGGYRRKANLSSFIAAFPISNPRYLVLGMIDEPHGNKESHGFVTAGWTAAPCVGRIITQIGPLLGVAPVAPTDGDAPARTAAADTKPHVAAASATVKAAPEMAKPSMVRKVSLATTE